MSKRWFIVICILIASALIIWFAVWYGKRDADAQPDSETEQLSLDGADERISLAERATDQSYFITVSSEGYGGPMLLRVHYDSAVTKVLDYEILSHEETEGLGALVAEDDYRARLAGATLPVYTDGMDAEELLGVISDSEGGAGARGNFGSLSTVASGNAGGSSDSGTDGNSSGGSNTGTGGNSTGGSDSGTGSNSSGGSNTGTGGNSSGGSNTGTGGNSAGGSGGASVPRNDGVYEVVGEEASNGYVPHVIVTIEGGIITNVTWDEELDGSSKKVQSEEGTYVMTEDGPTWKEQSETICESVVEHQSTDHITYDINGKTDAVSGVSISVDNFVSLVHQAIGESENFQPAPTDAPMTLKGTKIDALTGASYSSRAVMRAINLGYVFLKNLK